MTRLRFGRGLGSFRRCLAATSLDRVVQLDGGDRDVVAGRDPQGQHVVRARLVRRVGTRQRHHRGRVEPDHHPSRTLGLGPAVQAVRVAERHGKRARRLGRNRGGPALAIGRQRGRDLASSPR